MTNFKGWHVLGASFVTATILAGATYYSFQHFVIPLETEFDLTRDQINLGYIGFLIGSAIWTAATGILLKFLSPRIMGAVGICAISASFFLLARSQSPLQMLLLVLGPMGFGFTASGPFISNVLTTNWFYQNRGKALGLVAISTSLGGLTIQPLFGILIDNYGWRQASTYISLGMLLVSLPLVLKFFINKPEDIGQYPDGIKQSIPVKTNTKNPFIVFANPNFWLISIGCGLLFGCDQALLASLKPLGKSLGYENWQATMIPTVVAGSAIVGKIGIGWLADRFDKRKLFALVCLSNIIFLFVVSLSPSFHSLILTAGLVGLAIGGIYPVWTSITADAFGREDFAPALGFMNVIMVGFGIAALVFIGNSFEANNASYTQAFKQLIPVAILAAIVMMFVRTKGQDNA